MNPGTFSTLYKSLVRPVLENAAQVWNPYLAKDVLALALGQDCTKTRTLFLSLVKCYKIVFGMNKLNFDAQFPKSSSTLTNQPYKLYVKPATCNP